MSYAELLRKFAERPVTPVTQREEPEVTEKPKENHVGNLRYLGYPKQLRSVERSHKPRKLENPLYEIAQTLEANPRILRSLLSDDDMEDIAEGVISRSHLISYFRLMRSDGISLAGGEPALQGASDSENLSRYFQSTHSWKSSHEYLINHVMECTECYAPVKRYCEKGDSLRQTYIERYKQSKTHR